jgi:hypothetical protein
MGQTFDQFDCVYDQLEENGVQYNRTNENVQREQPQQKQNDFCFQHHCLLV